MTVVVQFTGLNVHEKKVIDDGRAIVRAVMHKCGEETDLSELLIFYDSQISRIRRLPRDTRALELTGLATRVNHLAELGCQEVFDNYFRYVRATGPYQSSPF